MTRAEAALTKISKAINHEFGLVLDPYPANGGRTRYNLYTKNEGSGFGRRLGLPMTIKELEKTAEVIADLEFERQWQRERQEDQP